ncbi:MAG: FecR domain-containing protein [Deltaproteobacteria bacterium]|nr:FecR domain-containing protein [Deltaproteobacteria bacterium]
MKREIENQNEQLGRAVADAFADRPACGALGSFDEVSRRRMIKELISTASMTDTNVLDEMDARKKRVTRSIVLAAAGIILFFAIGGVLWWGGDKSSVPMNDTYFGEVRACDGVLLMGNKQVLPNGPVSVGKVIYTKSGTAMLRLPTGIDWWMSENAKAAIRTLDEKELQVTVDAGEIWFRVDPKRNGPDFSVLTQQGKIDVTGTIFVVNVQGENTRLILLKGEVWVTHGTGAKERIASGHSIPLNKGKSQVALSGSDWRSYREQLATLSWDMPYTTEVGTDAEGTSTSENRLDPLDAPDINNAANASPTATGSPKATLPVSYDALIEEIYVQRKKGNWKKVEQLYKKLFRIAPGKETAVISRVTLGEIYLTKLHRYKDALAQFNKYIYSGHTALLPEAVYGSCNAYRMLAQREQEQRCLSGFIKQYNTSFQVSEAKARLAALRAE